MNRDHFVFYTCLAAAMVLFLLNTAQGATCTYGERQTMVTRIVDREFYVQAKLKSRRFFWTQFEADKLERRVYVSAVRRVDLLCNK